MGEVAPEGLIVEEGALATGAHPIIVTAQMGPADQLWADDLRRRHFPPDRNHLAAHITLFHHLPPGLVDEVKGRLSTLARNPRPLARLDRPLNLGRGVAFHIDSPDLLAMRGELAEAFRGMLTPQDQAIPRLHITIQNKVSPATVRATLAEVERDFRPRPLVIGGLAAWHYRGGPWSPIARYSFRG